MHSNLMRPSFDPGTLIYINTTNLPIGFIQGVWLTFDVVVASLELLRLFRTIQLKPVTGNTTTECSVQYQPHILEMVGTAIGTFT